MTPAWLEAAVLDLTGIAAVVTGASGGTGVQVARGLASKRAHVVRRKIPLITRRLILPRGRRDQARLVLARMDQDFRL